VSLRSGPKQPVNPPAHGPRTLAVSRKHPSAQSDHAPCSVAVVKVPPTVAILSDLDGTLIDSKSSVVAAFKWWAQLRDLDRAVTARIPFGRTSTDAAAVLAPHLDAAAEGAVLDARQATDSSGATALPGAIDLLSAHTRLAVVTSCPRSLAEVRIRAAQLPMPRLLLTPECWTRGKPNPEPYLHGAATLDADPHDCVVLEDSPSGVQSGIAAGMRVIAVLTSHQREQLPARSPTSIHCTSSQKHSQERTTQTEAWPARRVPSPEPPTPHRAIRQRDRDSPDHDRAAIYVRDRSQSRWNSSGR
jgi:sugar-phosphatase